MKPILSQTDLQIKSMHAYLKSKLRPSMIDPHTQSCVNIVNQASLHFFEITFKHDLERLGLI